MATVTINTTAPQDARIIDAFGKYLCTVDESGNPRNATGGEVKAALINFLKGTVLDQERKTAQQAINLEDLDPS